MIFLTVGTQLAFDRLVRAVDDWAQLSNGNPSREIGSNVFGQIADSGPDGYRPKNFEWTKFLDPEAFEEKFASADYIVAHAGMGTIIGALVSGKQILIMPRRADLREHRNDHQMSTAKRFADKQGVYVANTEAEVPEKLDEMIGKTSSSGTGSISEFANSEFIAALRTEILDQGKRGKSLG